jgi:hypothetical protein
MYFYSPNKVDVFGTGITLPGHADPNKTLLNIAVRSVKQLRYQVT